MRAVLLLIKRLINKEGWAEMESNAPEGDPEQAGKRTRRPPEETKARIQDAALKLFARKGYLGTSVKELGSEAGVNPAMINYFFGSKDGLLFQLIDTFYQQTLTLLRSCMAGERSFEEKVADYIEEMAAFLYREQELAILIFTEIPREDPIFTQAKADWVRKMINLAKEDNPELTNEGQTPLPMVMLGPPMLGMLVGPILFRRVLEEVRPPGFDDSFWESYPRLAPDLFLHGVYRGGKP